MYKTARCNAENDEDSEQTIAECFRFMTVAHARERFAPQDREHATIRVEFDDGSALIISECDVRVE